MRRFIVICLILLFPLQVFADSAEDYAPAYAMASDSLVDASCVSAAPQQFSVCHAAAAKPAPAHLDFADILIPAPVTASARRDNRIKPAAIASFMNAPPDRRSKPPPILGSASHAAHRHA